MKRETDLRFGHQRWHRIRQGSVRCRRPCDAPLNAARSRRGQTWLLVAQAPSGSAIHGTLTGCPPQWPEKVESGHSKFKK